MSGITLKYFSKKNTVNERTDETNLAKYQKLLKQDGKHWCSVAQLCLTLQPHGLQHARFPCPSPSPRV